ncbi:MAG TPA: NAD(P)-binding protein [Bryobacteraceae bacterium]|nr:NAD(P)-binding protein [Bryobacteraceae bacterium]
MTRSVEIVGGGPAGASAAISALQHGARVTIYEKSRLPRHKVCGEFVSPEIVPLLDRLGVSWDEAVPARIRRIVIAGGSALKCARLPEAAFGLSRWAFDDLLFRCALRLGAVHERQHISEPRAGSVWAAGRHAAQPRGARLFGFKAHFTGPTDDAVELYFFRGCYVGISTVENGITNVCGLGPEGAGFDTDALVASYAPLRERLRPLRRSFDWLHTGPLVFANRLTSPVPFYAAGDALSFVDPFTGSGQLAAVLTGMLAGECAALDLDTKAYLRRCRAALAPAFRWSSALRKLAGLAFADVLLTAVPARVLYHLTRPHVGAGR